MIIQTVYLPKCFFDQAPDERQTSDIISPRACSMSEGILHFFIDLLLYLRVTRQQVAGPRKSKGRLREREREIEWARKRSEQCVRDKCSSFCLG